MNRGLITLVIAMSVSATGCITTSVGKLAPIEPQPPDDPPEIEYTVGDFAFTLEGGKMITSNKAGRMLSNNIFEIWKKRGYISDFKYVKSGSFSGKTKHLFTLTGSQYGDSSVVAQVLSGLTLLIIPYTVDTKYDVQYTYENTAAGVECGAEVSDSYHTTVELLLFLAAPIAARGQQQTMSAMADHIYDQLQRECAFGNPGEGS